MNEINFAYWLQGFFELSGTTARTEAQVKVIKDHLALVFNKVTPSPPNSGYITNSPNISAITTFPSY